MRIVSLTFDDGFTDSFTRIAAIHEKFKLPACLNPIAWADKLDYLSPDGSSKRLEAGDWNLWRELASRGHEIMPHGMMHANKASLRRQDAQNLILRNLEYFEQQLPGFDRSRAVYNFPYNATTPELEAWLPKVVRAFRGGWINHGINPMPSRTTAIVRTIGHGPGNCEAHLDQCLAELLKRDEGWLVYNLHGLDEEGWGPIGTSYLERLLDRLVSTPNLRVQPVAAVLCAAS